MLYTQAELSFYGTPRHQVLPFSRRLTSVAVPAAIEQSASMATTNFRQCHHRDYIDGRYCRYHASRYLPLNRQRFHARLMLIREENDTHIEALDTFYPPVRAAKCLRFL